MARPIQGAPGRWSGAGLALLSVAGGLLGVISGEALLRLGEGLAARGAVRPEQLIEDPRLGRRLAPFAAGSDVRGFRNSEALHRTDVVAIGDSQTWGVNATSAQAWPGRLQALTGCSVYNMSGGGFGMVHYTAMLDEALSLRPRLVVVGLYLGNDLYDSYSVTYSRPCWEHLRLAGRPELLTDATRAKADGAWNDEKEFQYAYGRDNPSDWGLWLRAHTAVGRLLERAGAWPGADAWFEIGRAWAKDHPETGSYYDDGRVRTVFTVGYRRVALDLQDPRIAEGLRLTSELLAPLRARVESTGAKLLLLLIPTKECVFGDVSRAQATLTEAHCRLIRSEEACRNALLRSAEQAAVPVVDLLGPLKAAVARGQQVYPTNIESHPNPQGYDLIARTIAARIDASCALPVSDVRRPPAQGSSVHP